MKVRKQLQPTQAASLHPCLHPLEARREVLNAAEAGTRPFNEKIVLTEGGVYTWDSRAREKCKRLTVNDAGAQFHS